MFDALPNEALPGLRIRQSEDPPPPGLRIRQPEDTPGLRVADDGSAPAVPSGPASSGVYGNAAPLPYGPNGNAYDPLIGRPFFDPARGPSAGSGVVYVKAGGDQPGFFGRLKPILDDVGDAAEQAGTHANAFVNGAYSVLPGTYNALRALGRGVGLLGPEEFRRFGQEADLVGYSLGQIAKHPEPAMRAAGKTLSTLYSDPLFRSYSAGRIMMGILTGLGGAATAGDALRAAENGHGFIDSLLYGIFAPYRGVGAPPTR